MTVRMKIYINGKKREERGFYIYPLRFSDTVPDMMRDNVSLL